MTLTSLDLGPVDPDLGRTTLQPTVVRAGEARNQVPPTAMANLDLRTVPTTPHADLLDRLQSAAQGQIRVRSERLAPYRCPEGARIVEAALAARPDSQPFGSSTMSDLVWFAGLPGVKCGPGLSARSHRPDEFVLQSEIVQGASLYAELLNQFSGATSRAAAAPSP